MPPLRLSVKARIDLKDIGHYTENKWGQGQRNDYLRIIDDCLHDLSQYPDKGRPCNEIGDGYRKYQAGRHVIYYRARTAGIDVIRILHDRMDATLHLG